MSYNPETGMYEGYIYCIENMINGKKYVGYTKNNIEDRWSQHLSKTHHKEDNSIIHLAIDKYGEDNFFIYAIRIINSYNEDELINLLKMAESECIKEYNTISPNGYNILSGGEDVPINRITPLYQYDMNGVFIAFYKSITDAIQINGFDDNPKNSKLSAHLHTDHCAFGYLWNINNDDDVVALYNNYINNRYKRKRNRKQKSPIVQLDTDMNLIKTYDSCKCASNETMIPYSTLYNACSGVYRGHHYAKGFLWMFKDDYRLFINL